MKHEEKTESPRDWYLLIHQLPPRPLYLRAKIRQRLSRVGAVALKRSVYVLPHRPDCLEGFVSIAQEADAGGGEAFVCQVRFLERRTDSLLTERFHAERTVDYEKLAATIRGWRGSPVADEAAARVAAARKGLAEISRVDFFGSPGRADLERLIEEADEQLRTHTAGDSTAPSPGKRLLGRTWVTRRGIQVDRIASAWLVRRFVDRKARFRFVGSGVKEDGPRAGEISFDMVGGEFTHEGDRCTFETLLERTGLADRTLAQIAEIVHDIDLKDGKFGRPEAAGVEMVLTGLVLTNADDSDRLDGGMRIFDGLYESLRTKYRKAAKEERQ